MPAEIAAEAQQLLAAGPEASAAFLESPSAGAAVRKQGVRVEEMLQAAALPGKPNGNCSDGEARYARQLLAQVLWEEKLMTAATAPRERKAREETRAAMPPPRPLSARETRHGFVRAFMEYSAVERSEEMQRQWGDKERALEASQEKRGALFESMRDRRWQEHCQDEQRIEAFKNQEAWRLELRRRKQQSKEERRAAEQAAWSSSACQRFQAKAQACAADSTNQIEESRYQKDSERIAEERSWIDKAAKAQAAAEERRMRVIHKRGQGPPQLHAAREQQKRQAARMTRVRNAQRVDWCDRLDANLPPASSAPPQLVWL